MTETKSKILMIVEGKKTDCKLMDHLLNMYGIGESHEIVSYNTNIYTLYDEMFSEGDPGAIDTIQNLKEHETDPHIREKLSSRFSDILLIFDLDPQDPSFAPHKIEEMLLYFTESSDMGKLYLNYPMVEAFYHMKNIPDHDFSSYTVSIDELRTHQYKKRVNAENRNHNYTKFAVTRSECNTVIRQNICKGHVIAGTVPDWNNYDNLLPNSQNILVAQLQRLGDWGLLSVLCTCVYYIVDYNPNFILPETT